jgi:outer membrane biosynthesis protein TonB
VPTVVGRAHLVAAWDSLDELESALTDSTPQRIAEIASALIDDRAAAEAGGISVTTLDQALVETLAAVWPTLPPETQDLLIGLFGDIIGDDDVSLPPPLPSPTPEPTPSPDPEPEPSPAPSEGPPLNEASVPPPSESPSPPPTETTTTPPETTPPPTETTTPPAETTTPPTETTTPPTVKSETRSWSLALIPFALTLLLAISGWARRRSGETTGDPDGSDPS